MNDGWLKMYFKTILFLMISSNWTDIRELGYILYVYIKYKCMAHID